MSRPARSSRWKRAKFCALLVALLSSAWLGFTVFRVRRLLDNARQIEAHSASFSRDYHLGNGPQITVLVMGDSTAAGWGAENLDSTYPHQLARALATRNLSVRVVNVAVGGATLAEVRRDQIPLLTQVRPDFVTLSVGANDATHGTKSSDYERDLQQVLADLKASSARTIWVANVPDMFLAPALPLPLAIVCGRRARGLNELLNRAPKSSKVRIIDLFGRGKLDYQRDPALYAADLFHPSGRGYAKWAQLWIESVASFGFEAPKAR